MSCLIVTKPTNLEQHGNVVRTQIERGQLQPKNLIELQKAHDEHYHTLELVRESLSSHKIDFQEISRGDLWPTLDGVEFIMSVGGDGTLLSTSHHILDNTPVIGIRSSEASVGYLCSGGTQDIKEIVNSYINGELATIACARLLASIYYGNEDKERPTVPVLNDFLFANHNPSATTRYIIRSGDQEEEHKSSGVWISTATGSTAGIKAAGGSTMERGEKQFQYRVRELYRGPSYAEKLTHGFFNPSEQRFIIENRNEAAVLALDGQRGAIPLRFGDRITFKRAPNLELAVTRKPKKK